MERIEVNVETGEVKTVQLTAQEIAGAQARYEEWMLDEEQRKRERIDMLKAELAQLGQLT